MFFGEVESGANAKGDGFTVEKLAVWDGSFDGVANGVAEIE